jgi:hypothetical protein
MDNYQKVWTIFLVPSLLTYSIIEINRGWKILKLKKYSLNFAFTAQIWLVNLFQGKDKSLEYKDKLLTNDSQMRQSGYYSIFGAIIAINICIFWIYLLIKL